MNSFKDYFTNANTQKYGINSLNIRGSVSWNNLPIKLKECKYLQEFTLLLKQSGNLPCTFSTCKVLEFWLPIVLFLNFNIYVLFYSMYVCKYLKMLVGLFQL